MNLKAEIMDEAKIISEILDIYDSESSKIKLDGRWGVYTIDVLENKVRFAERIIELFDKKCTQKQ